ncbi:hypothetical protein Goari_004770, partial [Gossypium aridum]|nr:hypothetical protein [Gossypium aridum]
IDEGFAAAGGYVRNHKGEWIIGFARYLGNCSVLEAELWGILDGLNLTVDRCFQKVFIQTDNIEAIKLSWKIIWESPILPLLEEFIRQLKR